MTDTPKDKKLALGDMPSYGNCTANDMLAAVADAIFGDRDISLLRQIDNDRPVGHQMVPNINFNSLNRIISAFHSSLRPAQGTTFVLTDDDHIELSENTPPQPNKMTPLEEAKITHSGEGEYTPIYLTIRNSIVAIFAESFGEADPDKSVWMSHSQFEQIAAFCHTLSKPRVPADDLPTLHSETTPEGGVIRLSRWPEGYVLWHHGQIVWRSWAGAPKVITAALKVDARAAHAALESPSEKMAAYDAHLAALARHFMDALLAICVEQNLDSATQVASAALTTAPPANAPQPLHWFRSPSTHETVTLEKAATRFGTFEAWGGGAAYLDRARLDRPEDIKTLIGAKLAAERHYSALAASAG